MSPKHGYEGASIGSMREELKQKYPMEATEENLALTKAPLANLLNRLNYQAKQKQELKKEKVVAAEEIPDLSNIEVEIDDGLDNIVDTVANYDAGNLSNMEVEVDDAVINSAETPTTITPRFNSEGWSDYVLSQLTDDELQDGHPKCDGLRRLVEELVGPILSKLISKAKMPDANDNCATIAVSVECGVTNPKHPAYGKTIVEESISDANPQNNFQEPFSFHMSAVAETRAEARAYKRLLHLKNTVSAEEIGGGNDLIGTQPQGSEISTAQIVGIDRICQRLDIDVLKYISNRGKNNFESIDDVSFELAKNILSDLNAMSSEGRECPEELKGYKKDWRI